MRTLWRKNICRLKLNWSDTLITTLLRFPVIICMTIFISSLITMDRSIDHANMASGSIAKLLIMGHCNKSNTVLIELLQHIDNFTT